MKSKASYTFRHTGTSYTRIREVVFLNLFKEGNTCYYKSILPSGPLKTEFRCIFATRFLYSFGLDNIKSEGATAAANAGVNDRLVKRHG